MEVKNYVLKKYAAILCLLLGCLFTLSSCSDIKIAESMSGRWSGVVKSYDPEVGMIEENMTMVFEYDEEKVTGGTYTEFGSTPYIERVEDYGIPLDFSCTFEYQCTGTWDIINGDLALVYNTSSIVVNIKDIAFDLSPDASAEDRINFELYDVEELFKEVLEQEGVIQEMKNTWHASIYEVMLEHNKLESVYKNVKINNGVLTFITMDGEQSLTKELN